MGENSRAEDGSQAQGPKPVGQKQANAYALFDMLANVRDWVADWYGENYFETGPRLDPQGPPTGTRRVMEQRCGKLRACFDSIPVRGKTISL